MTVETSIVEAIRAIDQMRISHRNLDAENRMLRRRLAEAESERDTWRAKVVGA